MVKLSIIIATYNRAQNLARTLHSLTCQTLASTLFEIVVVNNNSQDDTETVCTKFANDNPQLNFKMVTEPEQGLSHARNAGIKNSIGEYIAIIDDDEEVNSEFAKSYYDFFEKYTEAAAAGGQIIPLYEYEPPRWLTKYTERPISGTLRMGSKIKEMGKNRFPGGGNMGIRRSMVEKYGAFNPELGRTGKSLLAGEEKDLFKRLRDGGEKIFYIPGAIIYHIIPKEKFSDAYFDRLTKMSGVSERVRTMNEGEKSYKKRLVSEVIKWEATLILALWYTLTFRRIKGKYLIRMRWNVTQGLIDMQ